MGGQSPVPQAGPWEKGPPAVWDSSKPLKCVWGGGQAGSLRAVTELLTPGDLAACIGAELCPFAASCAEMEMLRASGSRASHAPTMAFMSPRLCAPCLQAEGKRGSGAPGKGSGRREAFPSRTELQTAPGFPAAPGCRPRGFAPHGKERAGHARAAGSSGARVISTN